MARHAPDNDVATDAGDSGSYDVRELRKRGQVVYVERDKVPSWLIGLASTLLAAGIIAAWSANARLSSLETQVTDLKDTVGRLERLLENRYRGGPDEPRAR